MGTVIRLSIEHQHPDTLLQAEIKIRAWESQFSANDPKSDLMNVNQHAVSHQSRLVLRCLT